MKRNDHLPCGMRSGKGNSCRRVAARQGRRLLGLTLILLVVSACSTAPVVTGPVEPPLRRYEDLVKPGQPNMLDVKDSVEGFNRGSYRFNYYFDEMIYRPVVRGYEFITPTYVQGRVSDAIDNIGEITNLTNNLFQFKFKAAGITVSRFVINSTIGVGGLWDQARKMGLKRQTEDFGLTLGHYGTGSGTYLMLPVFGASNVRDTTGLVADVATSRYLGPVAWINDSIFTYAYSGIYAIDRRHRTPFRYRQTGSPFEYELIRSLYTMKRDFDIEQGQENK